MTDFITVSPDQLPEIAEIPEDLQVLVASPGGNLQRVAHSRLLSKLIATNLAKTTRAVLYADLAHDADSVALVFSDPTALLNGWYRKTGISGAGAWIQFETLALATRTAMEELLDLATEQVELAEGFADDAAASAAEADLPNSRREEFRRAVLSAAGVGGAIRLLASQDCERTFTGGESINVVTSLVGPNLVAAADNIYGYRRAVETEDGGIFAGAGFTATGANLAPLTDFAWDIVVEWPVKADEFDTVAEMNATLGTGGVVPANAIVRTHNGANIFAATDGYGQPPLDNRLAIINQTFLDGWYVHRVGDYFNDFPAFSNQLMSAAGVGAPGGYQIAGLGTDSAGRPSGFIYNDNAGIGGTGSAGDLAGNLDVYGARPGEPQHFRFDCAGGLWSIRWQGQELCNGQGSPSFPTSAFGFGGGFKIKAVCLSAGLDFAAKRRVSDAIAARFGTPPLEWTPVVDLVTHQDQSRTAGSGNGLSDPNSPDPISNYSSGMQPRDPGGDGAVDVKYSVPTLQRCPGLYVVNALGGSFPPSPWNPRAQIYGYPVGVFMNGGNESIEPGIWGAYRQGGGKNQIAVLGLAIGGQTDTYLATKTGKYLHSLPAFPIGDFVAAPRDLNNRAVKKLVEFFNGRGQKVRLVCLNNWQAETDTAYGGIYAQREAGMRAWADELTELVDIQSPPPLLVVKAHNYSGDGISGNAFYDNQQRLIGTHRDKRYRFRTYTSFYAHFGRFIHGPAITQRLNGEWLGDQIARAFWGSGDDEPVAPVTWTRVGANAVLLLNKPVDIVAVYPPFILGTLQTGGFNTYGIGYIPVGGVKAISGPVTLSGDGLTITIPISGGGPDVGDRITACGLNAKYTNFRSRERRFGVFPQPAWEAYPFALPIPYYSEGDLNEITEWLAAFDLTLA